MCTSDILKRRLILIRNGYIMIVKKIVTLEFNVTDLLSTSGRPV